MAHKPRLHFTPPEVGACGHSRVSAHWRGAGNRYIYVLHCSAKDGAHRSIVDKQGRLYIWRGAAKPIGLHRTKNAVWTVR